MQRKRRDLQGLRAVAVVLVIANHLIGWPVGGFLGVDVFFVLSGFLITGVLLREQTTTGRISLAGFYRRRVRRIVPAAVVVLIATTLGSALLFTSQRALSVLHDAGFALVFTANWRFLALGTNYFTRSDPPSPLQHFWSLSVEEQFYLLWPILLIALVALAASRPRGVALTWLTVGGLVAASLVWAIVESSADPTAAYFDTLTRIWELGAGGLLALAAPRIRSIAAPVRTAMSYLGLLVVVVAAIATAPVGSIPAPFGLLPVAGTLLVIMAGIGAEPSRQFVLANPVSQYLGDISYSLYLWHFPVIVLLAAVVPATSASYIVFVLAASLLLASASYFIVENPLNSSPLFNRFADRTDRRTQLRAWRARFRPVVLRGGVAFLVLGLLFSAALGGYHALHRTAAPVVIRPAASVPPTKAGSLERALADQLTGALEAKKWPTLTPSSSAAAAAIPTEEKDGCQLTSISDPGSCAFGDPSKPAIVVVGDSLGVALLPTVRAAYGDRYFIRGITMSDCVLIDLKVNFDNAKLGDQCLATRAAAVQGIRQLHPVAVFVTENYQWLGRLTSGASGAAAQSEWRRAASSTAAQLGPLTTSLIFVTPPPGGVAIADCDTALSTPSACIYPIPAEWAEGAAAERAVAKGNVSVLNTVGWYCAPGGECPIFATGITIKRDGVHPTRQWSLHVAPLFAAATRQYLG